MAKKTSKKKHSKRRSNKIYSANFFYFHSEYGHDFFNWYWNDMAFYKLGKNPNLRKMLIATLHKVIHHFGADTTWNNTVQFREDRYYAYYRIFKVKKITKDSDKEIRKRYNIPVIIHFTLDDNAEVNEMLTRLRLKKAFKKRFRKYLKSKKSIDTFDLFVFFTRQIVKRYKFRRFPKKWRIKGFKYWILKR